jgi:hypothetical protein
VKTGKKGACVRGDRSKIHIPNSLSGKMAIGETTLKDVMLIDKQNKKGDVLGKKA